MDWIVAEAPANIALIKYMGKVQATASTVGNISTNASLSFTLNHLRTRVRVRWEESDDSNFVWRPLSQEGFHRPTLSAAGQERFLRHADRCLQRLGGVLPKPAHRLAIESANGFPADCGLASSASSFAALTLAMAKLLGRDVDNIDERRMLSELSREGSGSSCRSLFAPWALWKGSGAEPVESFPAAEKIRHLAIIVDDEKKAVSSSEAHVRVTSSLLFRGRTERAEERLRLLIDNLRRTSITSGDGGVQAWNRAAHLVWGESWDMHALFESADPPFGYFVPGSVQALNVLREIATEKTKEFGIRFREPMVTMDAGPNVHVLLWNDDMAADVAQKIKDRLGRRIRVIDSADFEMRS